jgi:hypothetical protein
VVATAWKIGAFPSGVKPPTEEPKFELRKAKKTKMKVSVGIASFHNTTQRFTSDRSLMPSKFKKKNKSKKPNASMTPFGHEMIVLPGGISPRDGNFEER